MAEHRPIDSVTNEALRQAKHKLAESDQQYIQELHEEIDLQRAALQEWRDACSCGCDACVELIEALGLESSQDGRLVPEVTGNAGLTTAARMPSSVQPASEQKLLPAEAIALTVALAQVRRGDEPTPNVASVCVLALARLAGKFDWTEGAVI